jgi:signal recognition particle subunit SRP54
VGSGNNIQEVNKLVKQFEDTRKVMKMVNSGKAKNLMQGLSRPGKR